MPALPRVPELRNHVQTIRFFEPVMFAGVNGLSSEFCQLGVDCHSRIILLRLSLQWIHLSFRGRMPDETEPCPSCGRPTPAGQRCVYCSTVTDLDLKSLQLDYMKSQESDVPDVPVPASVAIVVQKTGQKITLKNSKVKIGRDPSNQVVIPDDTFTSRHHAWITFEEGDFWLEDLGSTNGTLLNGHPVVKRQVLSAGDKVRVGHTELTFEVEKN